MAASLLDQARSLSSGTLAGLIGNSSYAAIDAVHADFVLWCQRQGDQQQSWMVAWETFWARVKPGSTYYTTLPPTPDTLEQLACILSAVETHDKKRQRKREMELTLTQKQAPRKAQAEPQGLFSQGQQQLFGQ